MPTKFSGSEWIESILEKELPPFGKAVADLIGDWQLGIYHLADTGIARKPEWDNPHYIEIRVSGTLCTYDNSLLTQLVILAHDRCIRVEISPCNMQLLKIAFTARDDREGPIHRRHPHIEKTIEVIRGVFGEPLDKANYPYPWSS